MKKYILKKDFFGYKANQELNENEIKLIDISLYDEIYEISKEEKLRDLMNGCVIYKDEEANYITYDKDETPHFHHDLSEHIMWINYDEIYIVFEKEYNMKDGEILSFIKDRLLVDYNIIVKTVKSS